MRIKSEAEFKQLFQKNSASKPKQKKKRNQKERKECIEFNKLLHQYRNAKKVNYDFFLWHHSPNGGARNAIEGKFFKLMGVKKGFWDYFFLYGNEGEGIYKILFMEAKEGEKGELTKEQLEFQEILNKLGIPNYIFYTANDGINYLIDQKIIQP